MAVTAQAGHFGFGPQDGIDGTVGIWVKHRADTIDLNEQDDSRIGPPEVGGAPMPTLAYKAGYVVAGGATIYPRLEETFGWLLYGAMGSCTTTGSTGAYTHVFKPLAASLSYVPWMGFRKIIPKRYGDTGNPFGIEYTNTKLVGLTFTLPNDGLISARMDIIGADYEHEDDPDTNFSWDKEYEDDDSLPIGVVSGNKIELPTFDSGTELPIVAASVSVINQPLPIEQEKVYGSPSLEDVTIVSRRVTVDLAVKWNDPTLYKAILNGVGGSVWTPEPFTTDIEIVAQSPADMPGESEPYELKVVASKMLFSVTQAPVLAGNNAVLMRLQGVAMKTDAASYVEISLTNQKSQYVWDTPIIMP